MYFIDYIVEIFTALRRHKKTETYERLIKLLHNLYHQKVVRPNCK